jgi:hypothetical protein
MLAFMSKSKRAEAKAVKLRKPQKVNQALGRELILSHTLEPDLAWSLMQVARPDASGGNRYEVRVYSARRASAQGVPVRDYHSLDGHSGLILYHGWFDAKNHGAQLFPGPDNLCMAS